MKAIWVVGGRQKPDAHAKSGLHRYERGVVARVDMDGETSRTVFDYATAPELCPDDDPSVVFTAAHLAHGRIYIPTKTEVLIRSFPSFEAAGHVSLACFNDVHHVRLSAQGTLLVVNTGLDQVVECTTEGDLVAAWNVGGHEDAWGDRFSPDIDYRKVDSTKPHECHPNYLFFLGDEMWVTRFKQKDAISVKDPSRRIPIDIQGCHDGMVRGRELWFTTVDAHLVCADAQTLEISRVWDLNEFESGLRKLGWCRGLHLLDDDLVLVGFSRLRVTKWTENVAWAEGGLNTLRALRHRPTRIALYDLARRRLVWEHIFPDVDAVFSIHVAEG